MFEITDVMNRFENRVVWGFVRTYFKMEWADD